MEAIGQLTGGIAHDFNNLLTVIGGNLRFIQEDVAEVNSDVSSMLNDAICAAQDGAELTERLLAFSRTRILKPVVVSVQDLVNKFVRFLARTIGENVALETHYRELGARLKVDRVQLENSLLNLALNSRDSMAGGGTITIATELYDQDDTDPLSLGLPAGSYVRLTVTDTGSGIRPEVVPHVFEPFFTTKEVGQGTGLGLAVSREMIRCHDGEIWAESVGGVGTRFVVELNLSLIHI